MSSGPKSASVECPLDNARTWWDEFGPPDEGLHVRRQALEACKTAQC
jgi:hypothetical protein